MHQRQSAKLPFRRTLGAPLSRRRFVGAAGGAAIAAGIGSLSCMPSMGGGESVEKAMRSDSTRKSRPGGVLNLSMNQDLPSLDPNRSTSFLTQMAAGRYYSRLLRFETGPGVTPATQTTGDAAVSVEATDDGRTWTFHLRDGMQFHPRGPSSVNGRPLDSEDVAVSYAYFKSTNPARKILDDLVTTLVTPDRRTVVFKLGEPYASFPELIASSTLFWIMSKEAATGQLDTQTREGLVGTGPWMLDGVRPGVAADDSRNPSFYERAKTGVGDRSLPLLDGLRYSTVADTSQLQALFLSGEQHILGHPAIGNGEVLAFIRRAPDIPPPLLGTPAWQLSMYFFNLDNPANLFRDERLRRAFSMSIDRDALIETFGNVSTLEEAGFSLATGWNNSPVPWGPGGFSWWLDPKSTAMGYPDGAPGKWYRYSREDVAALLRAAAYGDESFDVETTSVAYGALFDEMAQAQNAMLTSSGFNASLALKDYRTSFLPEVVTKGNFGQVGFGFATPYTTVDEYLYNLLLPDSSRNWGKVNDPQLTALVRRQRSEMDFDRRQRLIYDIQRRCSDQMYYVPSVIGRWGTFTFTQRSVRNMAAFGTAGYGMGVEQLPHVWLDES